MADAEDPEQVNIRAMLHTLNPAERLQFDVLIDKARRTARLEAEGAVGRKSPKRAPTTLLSLPQEILERVFDHVVQLSGMPSEHIGRTAQQAILAKLSLVCQAFKAAAEPLLWRHVAIVESLPDGPRQYNHAIEVRRGLRGGPRPPVRRLEFWLHVGRDWQRDGHAIAAQLAAANLAHDAFVDVLESLSPGLAELDLAVDGSVWSAPPAVKALFDRVSRLPKLRKWRCLVTTPDPHCIMSVSSMLAAAPASVEALTLSGSGEEVAGLTYSTPKLLHRLTVSIEGATDCLPGLLAKAPFVQSLTLGHSAAFALMSGPAVLGILSATLLDLELQIRQALSDTPWSLANVFATCTALRSLKISHGKLEASALETLPQSLVELSIPDPRGVVWWNNSPVAILAQHVENGRFEKLSKVHISGIKDPDGIEPLRAVCEARGILFTEERRFY